MIPRALILALVLLGYPVAAGAEWVEFSLPGIRVRSLIQSSSGTWFAGGEGGLFRSLDGGSTWTSIETLPFDHTFVVAAGGDSNLVFAARETGIYRTSDDGISWIRLGDDVLSTYSLASAPNNDLYASGAFGTQRSTDRGLSWSQVGEISAGFTDGIAIDPNGLVFVRSLGADLHRSSDSGASWQEVAPTSEFKLALAVSPRTGTVLVGSITFGTPSMLSIHRSTDHGATWQRVVHRVGIVDAIQFLSNGDALAGADIVLHSTDDGLTWMPRNGGLPTGVPVTCFAQIQGQVFAGVDFLGLWREENLIVSVPLTSPASNRGLHLRATPSPFMSQTTLAFSLNSAARVSLDVYGLGGRRVVRLASGVFPAGPHSVPFDAHGLPAGVYFARLTIGGAFTSTRLVSVK